MKTYNEIKEILENTKNDITKFDTSDPQVTKSFIIYQITNKYSKLNIKVLENLTGLTFNTKEQLYDYFKINLKIDDITEWSFYLLEEAIDELKDELDAVS